MNLETLATIHGNGFLEESKGFHAHDISELNEFISKHMDSLKAPSDLIDFYESLRILKVDNVDVAKDKIVLFLYKEPNLIIFRAEDFAYVLRNFIGGMLEFLEFCEYHHYINSYDKSVLTTSLASS